MPFEAHPNLQDIEDTDVVLWRYVDLYRYLDLLQTAQIHLTRADQMEDRWEGSYSPVNLETRPTIYGEHWDGMSKHMAPMYQHSRTHIYLNCWYVGNHESYAMWRLYDASGKGVAIRTTAGRLKRSLVGGQGLSIHGARVRYVDYSTTFIPEGNMFYPYVHKRLSFAHEAEFRLLALWSPKVLETDEHNTAVKTEPDLPPPFLREDVDLGQLIESTYVSPDAPPWVAAVVTKVTHQYMPALEVRQSDLIGDPIF